MGNKMGRRRGKGRGGDISQDIYVPQQFRSMLNAILQLSQCYTGVGWGDMPSNFVGENMPMSPNNSGEGDIHQYFRI